MAELTDEEYEAASERGRQLFLTEPHARTVRYDRETEMIVIDLYNGCRFAVPPRQLQGLEHATDAEIGEVELSPFGYGLHWETLDADFTVRGLLTGWFGTERHMVKFRDRLAATYDAMIAQRHAAE